jgi:hypothetical protein
MVDNGCRIHTTSFFIRNNMYNAKEVADTLIDRAKNLQEFSVFRDMQDIVFNGGVIPYDITHNMGMPAEIRVPAISQEEAEHRVNTWLDQQRDAC